MAKIIIDDLNEDLELDREAMRAILGGSRSARDRLARQQARQGKTPQPLRLFRLKPRR
ncbi:hypothetical protein [Parahaliea mediterranea]|uniref:Uncharacterized protein n=1 Tax=Parahaliea mediterranea TaxID=651086 RepID=A0A939II94_9GAMM|nr:hypothetical protein [Parahaliea mediterranea]MBN7795001.1 hypothetical protein [Parahaliea mediterranea]